MDTTGRHLPRRGDRKAHRARARRRSCCPTDTSPPLACQQVPELRQLSHVRMKNKGPGSCAPTKSGASASPGRGSARPRKAVCEALVGWGRYKAVIGRTPCGKRPRGLHEEHDQERANDPRGICHSGMICGPTVCASRMMIRPRAFPRGCPGADDHRFEAVDQPRGSSEGSKFGARPEGRARRCVTRAWRRRSRGEDARSDAHQARRHRVVRGGRTRADGGAVERGVQRGRSPAPPSRRCWGSTPRSGLNPRTRSRAQPMEFALAVAETLSEQGVLDDHRQAKVDEKRRQDVVPQKSGQHHLLAGASPRANITARRRGRRGTGSGPGPRPR